MGHRSAHARVATALLAATAVALTACTAVESEPSADGLHGHVAPVVESADTGDWALTAWAVGAGEPIELGRTTTDEDGAFHLDPVTLPEDRILLVEAAHGGAERADLVAVSASDDLTELTLNERTTVAAAYGLAQFFGRELPSGENPGLANATAMAGNLADPATGAYGEVLMTSPNAYETQTLPAFTSLSNIVGACLVDREVCHDVYAAAGVDDTASMASAIATIARDPSAAAEELFELSQLEQGDRPGLDAAPAAWTLALRFDGDGTDLAGPGNFAIDPDGNIWINNNYEYNADPQTPVCGSDQMFKFSPTGALLETYEGGGLSGSGYGIEFTADGLLWFSNFGFAAASR